MDKVEVRQTEWVTRGRLEGGSRAEVNRYQPKRQNQNKIFQKEQKNKNKSPAHDFIREGLNSLPELLMGAKILSRCADERWKSRCTNQLHAVGGACQTHPTARLPCGGSGRAHNHMDT